MFGRGEAVFSFYVVQRERTIVGPLVLRVLNVTFEIPKYCCKQVAPTMSVNAYGYARQFLVFLFQIDVTSQQGWSHKAVMKATVQPVQQRLSSSPY